MHKLLFGFAVVGVPYLRERSSQIRLVTDKIGDFSIVSCSIPFSLLLFVLRGICRLSESSGLAYQSAILSLSVSLLLSACICTWLVVCVFD